MKLIRYILICAFSVFALSACEDTLEPEIDNSYGAEYTWVNPDKAEGVLLNAYSNIDGQFDHYGNNFLDAATDNAVTNNYSSSAYQLASGSLSSSSNPIGIWDNCYTQIGYVNMFLEYGLSDDITYYLPDAEIDSLYRVRLKGEAYFLRAFWSMKLLQIYGGVTDDGEALGYPISIEYVDSSEGNVTEDVARDSYEDCVQQIMADCDTAIYYLPAEYGSSYAVVYGTDAFEGRATSKAAHALKSRVTIYGASPAYQPEGAYSISSDSITSKWERAALVAYEAINTGELGSFTALTESMLAGSSLSTTPDDFLFREYHNNNSLESRNLPPDFNGNGYTSPSQNLVNAFPDSDGYPITDSRSSYDPQNPYDNRDPRMDLVLYHNGDAVEDAGRALEIYEDIDTGELGTDAPGAEYRNTRTGYYLRKWLSQTADMLAVGEKQNAMHMHAILRRAEVYYNWAEASNEAVGPTGIVTGTTTSALEIMRTIRNESIGISNDVYLDEVAGMGTDDLRDLIQNDRRIEFAFENLRYFDMRRWLLPLNETVTGCTIEMSGDELTFYGTDPEGTSIAVEERNFDADKYYYGPIPTDELVKSPNMKNNKGW
ncbi:RagB/SusD family nutrient uptake outer membrane protein [Labilibaculum sp.]|uniref:RagB/SusD family nutrient uptake outer membrane protein n=1 Tax=Labilibaculum sp. TaxID=2060723 RepID=UPI00356157C8